MITDEELNKKIDEFNKESLALRVLGMECYIMPQQMFKYLLEKGEDLNQLKPRWMVSRYLPATDENGKDISNTVYKVSKQL